jgi:MFS family permease
MIILGTILQSLGLFMASLSTQYWQLFLAQGVCLGLGNGCLFCPIVSLVSTYFSTKRSLAIGIVACGSATGGLVFPAMVQQLLPKVGFGWTLRAVGFVQMVCLVLCIIFAKQRLPPRRAGPIVEWAAFTELPYSLFAAGIFFVSTNLCLCQLSIVNDYSQIFWGVYFAFYYVSKSLWTRSIDN